MAKLLASYTRLLVRKDISCIAIQECCMTLCKNLTLFKNCVVKHDPKILLCSCKNLARILCKKPSRWARKWPNFLQDSKILASHARLFARNCIVLQQDTQHNLARSWSTWVTTSPPRCFSTKNHMFGSAHKSDHDGIVRMDIAK